MTANISATAAAIDAANEKLAGTWIDRFCNLATDEERIQAAWNPAILVGDDKP